MVLSNSEVEALKSSLEFWFVVEYVSTVIVLLGVVGEYVAEFTAFAKRRRLTRPLGKFSTLVLIVGLAGELIGLGRTSAISDQLTAFLETRITEAERQAAEANLKAEEERHARMKIEERLAPRHLTEEQQKTIADKLRSFIGQKLNVMFSNDTPEVANIAREILFIFKEVEWQCGMMVGHDIARSVSGILVEVLPGADAAGKAAAQALASALRSEKLSVIGPIPLGPTGPAEFMGETIPDAQIKLTIGKK